MKFFASLLCLIAAPAVSAAPLPFDGRWLLDDPMGAQASHTVLAIKGESMSWSGPNKSAPGCVQEFMLKKENPGAVYVDGRGRKFLAGVPGSLPTYLLKLRTSTCGRIDEEVRISFPLVYDTGHIELIEYVNGKPISSRRLRRKK
jgi:hypothetical protein